MGSEILDSSGRVDQTFPAMLPEDLGPDRDVPLLELDELRPVPFHDLGDLGHFDEPDLGANLDTETTTNTQAVLNLGLRGLVTDRRRRRTALTVVASAVVLMLLTGLAVSTHQHRQVAAAQAAQLAVDARITEVPQLTGDSQPAPLPTDDEFSVKVLIHNLGARTIQLMGATYVAGRSRQSTGTLFDANVAIGPGQQLDTGFRAKLPCQQGAFVPEGPVLVTARLRTADGVVHNQAVDTGALDDFGGLFQACAESQAQSFGAGAQITSEVDGRGVRMTVTITSPSDPPDREVHVTMAREGVPSQVHFVSSPALPWVTTSGRTDNLLITPVVHGCPKTTVDTDALNAIGLSVNGQTQADEYLPLLTAEAIGRACGGKR